VPAISEDKSKLSCGFALLPDELQEVLIYNILRQLPQYLDDLLYINPVGNGSI